MPMNGKEIRVIRKQLDWTQARLAEEVGVTTNTVARWERDEMGIREPAVKLIRMIAATSAKKKKRS